MIKTTHVGSLPRSQAVVDCIFAQERGDPLDPGHVHEVMSQAVDQAVKRQIEAGIDFVSDGEMSKISYATYIKDRFTGFDGDSPRKPPADLADFPSFMDRLAKQGGTPSYRRPCCVGPISVKSLSPLEDDLTHLKAAVSKHGAHGAFMNSASPGVVALFQPNHFYPDDDAYLDALAQSLQVEYERIASAGIMLQIDSPDLGLGRHMMYRELEDAPYLKRIQQHIEVMNHALRHVPKEQIRMHICWGNYEGPHHKDVPLEVIFETVLRAKPQQLLFETANPRHAHEWETVEKLKALIPEDKVLVPGVIDTTTNFVEHPRLVAQRLARFTQIVGRDRVIAGTDCGFGTFAGFGAVDEEIVYAKLRSLVEGASLVS